ncbi:hypothetical protein CEP10_17750 [Cylindrospermopsis raciborskii S07]|uniref:Uncharacterized protein n=1 Tax=Cylindrospermopsis raciborskii CS-505 TaxID=533240 RepID=A0A853MFI4_9CYAN|nr:hypothetical protein CRC_00917 [Cylindrospermopsis raciborskii CS-505]PNJ99040.1 hypothetical protein CEP14_02075 [Cylindrospermopsis raciborskii C04]PNK01896.1 hypothetical protein CEP10_17750 [Cylindrospermopsis raciborskii S07]PNK14201.1 hypothetical protein CEP08_13440 [Cylindrospermopsis raciborskii S05]PNK16210.1 hypothetical protein CEP09_07460 [Cylindrospermopsis raciborskii S06]
MFSTLNIAIQANKVISVFVFPQVFLKSLKYSFIQGGLGQGLWLLGKGSGSPPPPYKWLGL